MAASLRIIVTGLIAQYPLGGVTWDYLQYVLGLVRLGHDVYYLEDTGQWPYNPLEDGVDSGCAFNVQYLGDVMSRFGLGDRWMYRFPWESQWFGMSELARNAVLASADLLINVSGTLGTPAAYRGIPRLAYIDSDPVFTQIKLTRGQADFRNMVDLHDVHFSFGESLSEAPAVPDSGHCWLPTRQPVVLSEWQTDATPRPVFSTVMNWTSYKPIVYGGRTFGQKDEELKRFIGLPARVAPTVLELAIASGNRRKTPYALLTHKGWQLASPAEVCPDMDSYRSYIASSCAEFSVAKNGYVVGQSGWFSCRSACYLAAGRPVVVQDTGFGNILPVGEGILPFSSPDEAEAAIRAVEGDYARHARAAHDIAQAYFDSDRVLADLIERAGMSPHRVVREGVA
jgi:hypothetical protein